MNTTRLLALLAFVALPANVYKANATPGELDLNFGDSGKVSTEIAGGDDIGYSSAMQSDGKILIVGHANFNGSFAFSTVRLNPDGSLDTSFYGVGKVITDFGSGNDYVRGVAIQSNGKIVVAGSARVGNSDDFALVRYNSDGTLDTSFNGTGKATTAIGEKDDYGNSVNIQADGKIVVAGSSYIDGSYQFAVVRYNVNGTLDLGFNGTGMATLDFGPGEDAGNHLIIQDDGKLVIAGYASIGGKYEVALVRYDSNGVLDASFNGSGRVTAAIGGREDVGYGIALQNDAKIVVGGYSINAVNDADFALLRFNPDGSLDTSFNGDGIVSVPVGNGYDIANSVEIQNDGKIVAAGTSFNGINTDFALLRFNPDGSLDTGFNGSGEAVTDFYGGDDRGNSVSIQQDGKIVVAGYAFSGSNYDFALARYEGGSAIPEPSTCSLLGIAISSMLAASRSRSQRKEPKCDRK